MKTMYKIITICLLLMNSVLYSDTINVAKKLSFDGLVKYIEKDYLGAIILINKSIEIRDNLNLRDETYEDLIKLVIYAHYHSNTHCNDNIDTLFNKLSEDLLFIKDFNEIKDSCYLKDVVYFERDSILQNHIIKQ